MVYYSAYADDVTFFIDSEEGISSVLNLIEKYGDATGAQLNRQKTKAILWGRWELEAFRGISVPQEPVRILGVYFDRNGVHNQTWVEILKSMRETADAWSTIEFSISNRGKIANAVLVPKCSYAGLVESPPGRFMKKFHKVLFSFVWKNRNNEGLSRATLHRPRNEGGLDIKKLQFWFAALQFCNTRDILRRGSHPSAHFIAYLAGGDRRYFFTNFRHAGPQRDLPYSFYRCGRNFERHCENPDNAKKITPQHCYLSILERPTPRHANVVTTPDFAWDKAWNHVNFSGVDSARRDFNWKVAHDILPTRAKMHRWHATISDVCLFCSNIEDVEHLLLRCPFAAWIWVKVSEWAGLNAPPTLEQVMFNHPPPTRSSHVYLLLITETKYQIWKERNRVLHSSHATPNRVSVLFKIKCGIRRSMLNDVISLPSGKFKSRWLGWRNIVRYSHSGPIFLWDRPP